MFGLLGHIKAETQSLFFLNNKKQKFCRYWSISIGVSRFLAQVVTHRASVF
jgi:hypothetical protein